MSASSTRAPGSAPTTVATFRFGATGATGGAAQRELKRKLAEYTEAQKADVSTGISDNWPWITRPERDAEKIVLSQVMALAVRHDAIRANPVQMTEPPKKHRSKF